MARQTSERLIGSRAQLLKFPCLLGFDGSINESLQLIEDRQIPTKQTRLVTLRALGVKLQAGGKVSFATVPQSVISGGSGPMMSSALNALGAPVHYIGMLGYPQVAPIFAEFAKRTKVLSIADPIRNQTFHFSDGKLLFSDLEPTRDVSWETIKRRLGETTLRKLWNRAHFVAMVNWAMLPHLPTIWKRLLSEHKPLNPAARKLMFFDLNNPSERLGADLHAALTIIAEFGQQHDVILGLNNPEAQQVARVLRLPKSPCTPQGSSALAAAIRERLDLKTVLIHLPCYAAGANRQGEAMVPGPYTTKPKMMTGAGDHCSAGFVVGHLLDLPLAHSLQLAVAAAGFYVRHATSPSREQLVRFLQTL